MKIKIAFIIFALILSVSVRAGLPVTSGLVLHLDSTVGITLDGSSNVELWADQSGNGNNAAQSNSGLRPDYDLNVYDGRQSIDFSVGGKSLTSTIGPTLGTGARTVFAFHDVLASSQADIAFAPGGTAVDGKLWGITDTTIYGRGGPFDVTGLASFGGSNEVVYVTEWDGVDGDASLNRWRNKTQVTTGGNTAAWNTNAGFVIGNWANFDRNYVKDLFEIVIYNRVLTTQEREDVVDYLLDHSFVPFVASGIKKVTSWKKPNAWKKILNWTKIE